MLAKHKVAGSTPVARSLRKSPGCPGLFPLAHSQAGPAEGIVSRAQRRLPRGEPAQPAMYQSGKISRSSGREYSGGAASGDMRRRPVLDTVTTLEKGGATDAYAHTGDLDHNRGTDTARCRLGG